MGEENKDIDIVCFKDLTTPFLAAFKQKVLIRFPEAQIENEHEIKFNSRKAELNGLILYRFSLVFDGERVTIDFDIRESWNGAGIEKDVNTRDFTINSLSMYKDGDDYVILSSGDVNYAHYKHFRRFALSRLDELKTSKFDYFVLKT